jgi:hypothetical protein
LVISIGILVLMMSLVGQIFNITVQSTGQATALTEIMQQLRVFERTLREDLRTVQPGNSLILIQGNPVNAYWTQSGKDADNDGNPSNDRGYPADPEREILDGIGNTVREAPRADILMIFTARPGASFVEAGTAPLTSNLQQVVYGHAELGEYVANPDAGAPNQALYKFQPDLDAYPQLSMFPLDMLNGALYPSTVRVAPVPAAQWHLARRSVLLIPTDPPTALPTPVTFLDDPRLLDCETDVIHNFRYEDTVLHPVDPQPLPPWGSQDPWFPPSVFGNTLNIPFADWHQPYARSKLDPAPPALFATRIGHYLLPNCASFKVEWTLNPRSEFVAGRFDGVNEVFWFDPGDPTDPLRSLADAAETATGTVQTALECLLGTIEDPDGDGVNQCVPEHADGMRYSLANRFRGTVIPTTPPGFDWAPLAPGNTRSNLVVFTALRPGAPGSEPVFDPMFPGALRITIDVFDKEHRLERPIRHVMTIPIGG